MVSGTRALPKKVIIEVGGGSGAAAPKGPMTYAFTHEEISSFPSSGLGAGILAWRMEIGPLGWVVGL